MSRPRGTDAIDLETAKSQAIDREWFAKHPHRCIYLRPAIHGFEAANGDVVAVRQIVPGVRLRAPFTINPLVDWKRLNANEGELIATLRKSPMAEALGLMKSKP